MTHIEGCPECQRTTVAHTPPFDTVEPQPMDRAYRRTRQTAPDIDGPQQARDEGAQQERERLRAEVIALWCYVPSDMADGEYVHREEVLALLADPDEADRSPDWWKRTKAAQSRTADPDEADR
jgi:hypothetical protein